MNGVKILDPQSRSTNISISIAGFEFDGPFASCLGCKEDPGILAILEFKPGGIIAVMNLYQSANIRSSAYLELSYYAQFKGRVTGAAVHAQDCGAQISSNLATRLLESVSLLSH